MKTLVDHLSNYAAYHRDRRNIATHFVGIPMIVFAVQVLLARPAIDEAGLVSPALVATAFALLFYARLSIKAAAIMGALLLPSLIGAAEVGALATRVWLSIGLGMFLVGWVIQFVGHIFEGRKPAFVDDLIGLLVGPLFVVAEVGFALGVAKGLQEAIEDRAGPTHGGTRAHEPSYDNR